MQYTAERHIPNAKDVDPWHLRRSNQEHINRYHFAKELARGKVVLDVSCGTGYGSFELAKVAKKVIGVDIDSEAVDYAKMHNKKPNLSFVECDAENLPFDSGSFDLVASFETIEHLRKPELLVTQVDKVLKDKGLFVGSTPRDLHQLRSEFHLSEFSQKRLYDLLKKYFPNVVLLGQENIYGSLIKEMQFNQGAQHVDLIYAVEDIFLQDTLIFVCSRKENKAKIPSVLDIDISGYVKMLEAEIKRLDDEIRYRDEIIESNKKMIENKDKVIESMRIRNIIRNQLKKLRPKII